MRRGAVAVLLGLGLGCSSTPSPAKKAEPTESSAGTAPAGGTASESATESTTEEPAETEPAKPTQPTNRSPVARVSPTSVQVQVGQPIHLDASRSSDPDGSITSYTWRVGSGNPVSAKTPEFAHTFHEPGLQTVLLTVEDDRGGSAVFVVQVSVKE